ncbi:MAG: dicarboxylate/amino acid:cation symporter, partial [Spirochaetales bacterium]|nr:dicarboxylate/amino acid:cation symporter [Spirochaetales bacterium]
QRGWNVTADSIGTVSEQIRQKLTAMKASKREIASAELLLEEIAVRMFGSGTDSVNVRIRKIMGEISLVITADGEEYNPFASLSEWDTESEDYYRDMIFRSYQSSLSYSRRNKRNIVTVCVHNNDSKAASWTFIAMILGIAFGFAMKWMPESVSSFINNNILSLVQTLFMNALQMLIAPVVFFSLTTSIAGLSGGKEIGRIGTRTVSFFVATSISALVFGLGLTFVFFNNGVANMTAVLPVGTDITASAESFSIINMIIDIIPKNLALPIYNNNMIQVIFVSVLVGIALSILGDSVGSLKNIFNEAGTLFVRLVSMVITCMPIVAFAAMATHISQNTASAIAVVLKFILAVLAGTVVLIVMNSRLILIFGRLSPLPYIKKALPYLTNVFMISSSSACIPMTLNTVRQKLGVSGKVSSFVVPVGATVNMNGTCLQTMLAVIMLMKMMSMQLTVGIILKIALFIFLLSVGSPGVPNSSLIVIALMLSILGLPAEALGVLIGIWNIVDRIATVNNVNGDIAVSVIVSASEKDLDRNVYYGK